MKFLTATQILSLLLLTTTSFVSGCAAFRPINGVPARYLAPELRAQTRSNKTTIDLSLLAQKPPLQHHVDGRDVLGIFIEGVLGGIGEAPPINVPTSPDLPPSIGYPITVRDDGTLSLPMIGTTNVRGMTIRQVEEHLRRIYTVERKILKKGADSIIVSLQRPRDVRVLVLRQETGGPGGGGAQFAQGLTLNLGQSKRGNGQVINLPIYKNDVLHALARTGGLPGLDAENTIYIIRREHSDHAGMMPTAVPQQQVPVQQQPVTQKQLSSYSRKNASGIQLVGYHPAANSASTVEQVTAYNITSPSPASMGYNNQNQQPVYQNGYFPNPDGPVRSSRFSIEPVTASNFGNPDPLAELRAGMQPAVEPAQDYFSAAEQKRIYQQVAMQREVILEQPASSNFNQPGYNQPNFNQPNPHVTVVPAAPIENTTSNQLPLPEMNTPANNFAGVPQTPYETECEPFTDQDPLWTNVDLGINNFNNDPTMNNQKVIKIPIRLNPGQQPHIRPEDIILQDGDIVFIESRDTEIFYTGGLLGGGQYTLPRDYDLDVLGAISLAQGSSQQQSTNQIGGASALNGDVTISASSVIILRRMPNGSQVPIKIDLYRAMTDPSERVLIQPGDIVMLRYKVHEAIGAFIERNILSSALLGIAATQFNSGGN